MTGLEDFEALAVASSDVVLQPVPLPIPQRLRTPVSALADERLFERTVPYAAASEVNGPNAFLNTVTGPSDGRTAHHRRSGKMPSYRHSRWFRDRSRSRQCRQGHTRSTRTGLAVRPWTGFAVSRASPVARATLRWLAPVCRRRTTSTSSIR